MCTRKVESGLADGDLNIHRHVAERTGWAEKAARYGHGLLRRPGHADPDQVAPGHPAIGGIELNPTSARQVDFHPGMRGATPNHRFVGGNQPFIVEIAADESGCEAEGIAPPPS